MEKAWAKLNGNYEAINFGWQSESLKTLNGAPSNTYTLSSLGNDVNRVWPLIQDAINNNFIIGADTNSSNAIGLVTSHAYTVLA